MRAKQVEVIGILGGSFDPVHHGHLRLAVEALERLQLSEVRLIPVRIPPHRAKPRADESVRQRMLAAAIKDSARLVLDERELHRDGVSYTVDTLASLRAEFPGSSLCLLLGLDAFLGIPTWHRWRKLLELAHIGVATRPGASFGDEAEITQLLAEHGESDIGALRSGSVGSIVMFEPPPLQISSTYVRDQVRKERCIRYLVPAGVLRIIEEDGLYLNE